MPSPLQHLAAAGFALCASLGAAQAAKLHIQIDELPETRGHLLIAISDSAASWDGEPIRQAILPADGPTDLTFTDLPPGRYAVAAILDANDNRTLDTDWMGRPKEAYGYSNNPRPWMRKATFDEAAFELTEQGTSVEIHLQ